MRRFAAAILSFLILAGPAAASSDFRFSPRPNKAHLIHWRQWDPAVFSDAKRLRKPVLLALSAVWCHWCHVMDETTYSDAGVITFINEHFIPVRVDADMRPDLDALYNQGGWPSTLVLTPEGDIAQGGTYIEPEEMAVWLKTGLAGSGGKRRGAGEEEEGSRSAEEPAAGRQDLKRTIDSLRAAFDRRYGGFGAGQKFPNPAAIDFLLSEYARTGDGETREMISLTLDRMKTGEIYDRFGGGFFRYATRPDWSSPHYEKMLDLNAGIAENYASASMVLGDKSYRQVLGNTISYALRTLYDRKTGAFYGSQDADEGYYAAQKRDGRPPRVDSTIYAGPNARMIAALVASSCATGSKQYLEQAEETTEFMLRSLYSEEEGVFRYYLVGGKHLPGLLADNVAFGNALVDLYNATGKKRYIEAARNLARLLSNRFFDVKRGLFRTSIAISTVRPSEPGALSEYTSAVSNLEAAVFLMRISGYQADKTLRELAARATARTREDCNRIGPAAGFCGRALAWQLIRPLEVVIITDRPAERFLKEVNRIYVPLKVVRVLSPAKDKAAIEKLGYPLKEALYLCAERSCFAAVAEPAGVTKEIKKYMERIRVEK